MSAPKRASLTAKTLLFATCFGMMLTVSAAQAKPTTAPVFGMVISNTSCFSGSGLEPYIQQASVQRATANRSQNPQEGGPQRVAVPARAWRGLTVTGVGLYYSQTAVLFREPVPVVRRALRRSGVRVLSNGSIPMNNAEAVEVQGLRATIGAVRAFGASEVTCGT